jgi:uncharacterized protein
VPMSVGHTGRAQLDRLRAARLRIRQMPELVDVDTAEDAALVARQAPGSRFAATLAMLAPENKPAACVDRRGPTAGPRSAAMSR